MDREPKPIKRSKLRAKLGFIYYGTIRRLKWIKMRKCFAKKQKERVLGIPIFFPPHTTQTQAEKP